MSLVKIVLAVVAVLVIGLVALIASVWAPDRPVDSLKARWAPPPSRFVTLDGMQVHVRDEGPRDDPTPIVFIHGTGSSLHSWQALTEGLRASHRVIRFDRPGFGLTGPNPSGDYSMAYYSDFTARLLDQLGVKRAVMVGNSSGGYVAWRFAVDHPDRTAALILLSPAGMPRTTPLPAGLRAAMSPQMGPVLEHVLPRGQVRKGLEGTYGDPSKVTEEAVERSYELTLRAGNRRALGETLRQAQLGGVEAPMVKRITAPTLIVWGVKDTVVPYAPDAARFHEAIAGSQLVSLPAVGHMPQEEAPEETRRAIAAFLAGLPAASPVGAAHVNR